MPASDQALAQRQLQKPKLCGHWLAIMAMGIVLLASPCAHAAPAEEKQNFFGDPFLQVTDALPACPPPEPPGMTPDEVRAATH
ncbi:MAG: hypothetical protein JWR60_1565, partial [Polaromonas sp.]|nr:hypothetical protein [Polaromonas sp.]